jgi:hypothetical protein
VPVRPETLALRACGSGESGVLREDPETDSGVGAEIPQRRCGGTGSLDPERSMNERLDLKGETRTRERKQCPHSQQPSDGPPGA